jgi:hypothetical protein
MTTYAPRAPFSEGAEQELAAELLAVTNDQELDRFLGALLRLAASAVGGAFPAPVGRELGGLVKGAVLKALRDAGGLFNNVFASAPGGPIEPQRATAAGRLLGLEREGLSPEDQEFTAARQLVRLAGAAAVLAAASPSTGTSAEVARQAMIQAARRHAPGLVRSAPQRQHSRGSGRGDGGGTCSCEEAKQLTIFTTTK